MFCLLALLFLSTRLFAQPVEGPWEITEGYDGASLVWPVLSGDEAEAVEVFYVLRAATEQWIERRRVLLPEFAISDSLRFRVEDTLYYRLTDVLLTENGSWVVTAWSAGGSSTSARLIMGDSVNVDTAVIATGWHSYGPNARGTWVTPPSLSHWTANGCIAYWFTGDDNNWAGEPHQIGAICYVPDVSNIAQRTLYTCLLGDFLYGPSCMAVHPFSDDSLVVIQSLSPDYPGFGIAQLGILHPNGAGNLSGTQQEFSCGEQPIVVSQTLGHNWLLLANPDSPRSLSFDFGGSCTEVANFGPTSAVSWHHHFGFAMLNTSSSAIRLTRADTSGALAYPEGVFYWRDPEHVIETANVALTDSGRIVVAWTERNETTDRERLMIGTVGWDTPLASDPSVFILPPFSFSLSAYPNPFNSTLEIRYALPRAGKVEVAVFNVLGQKVATLENGMRSAGTHNAKWTATGGSGIYFVTLQTEHEVRTEKVLLAR